MACKRSAVRSRLAPPNLPRSRRRANWPPFWSGSGAILEDLTADAHISATPAGQAAGRQGCLKGPVKVASRMRALRCHECHRFPVRFFSASTRSSVRSTASPKPQTAILPTISSGCPRRARSGTSPHHACGRGLHARSARRHDRGKPARHPRPPGRRQEPALPSSRHRGPPVPAHLRAGGRDGGSWRRSEKRIAVDRSRAS